MAIHLTSSKEPPINAITSQEMQRLAFIRLLVQQGVEQSAKPEPIAAAAILTFHDAVELFLMLTSEHLGVTVPDKGAFVPRYFDSLHPDKAGPRGIDLEGKLAVKRLTDHRNAFKHAGALPSGSAVEQARDDTERFFEANTPKVFKVAFGSIDMVELIPQAPAREHVRSARIAWEEGERLTAMGTLAVAFEELFAAHLITPGRRYSPFAFGPAVESSVHLGMQVARAITTADGGRSHRNPTNAVEKFGQRFERLSSSVSAMQSALSVMTLGLDLHRYFRFKELCPDTSHRVDGRLEFHAYGIFQANEDDFAYCEHFVLSAALRLAELEAHTTPTWRNDPNR
ncbi:hypothetical protein [Streptomyces amakusaensis]|uniref:HEPN AbiU2-like domain-containing protein n=1 Tax=Streptomyces amakusaensis TaxID=67271 RepID=A0ABW0AQ39_9ACTN